MSIIFNCLDCGINTQKSKEVYMVRHDLWDALTSRWKDERDGMLCIGCLEKRWGHRLTPNDFTKCPLNSRGMSYRWPKSPRLQNRLGWDA